MMASDRSRTACLAVLIISTCCLVQCTTTTGPAPLTPLYVVPNGFPEPIFPADNLPSAERIALGKALFMSTALSRTNTMACASCHQEKHAFADTATVSIGIEGRRGTRNAPSLFNVAYHPYYMREGGVPTLEMQVQVPIEEHNEFDFNILQVQTRLAADTTIVAAALRAYGRLPDPFVITRAIACFERTLLSGASRVDRQELTNAEQRGRVLFESARTNCTSCHGGFNYTTYAFENNGLAPVYADSGRYLLTRSPADIARFKVPSLRHVGQTAPYMHDGSTRTLRDVLDHYNSGGYLHPQKSPLIRPLGLSPQELDDLEAFLRAL